MFALGIRYLNGWAMATHVSDRENAEWPPHPDRLFMALAAAHFETDGGAEERAALEWLQSLPPPAMTVNEAGYRELTTSYVPVNDTEISRPRKDSPQALKKRLTGIDGISDIKAARSRGLALLPDHRSRQARAFPIAIPKPTDKGAERARDGMPRVYFSWETAIPSAATEQALEVLCSKVTHVGHSASFVQAWMESSPPEPSLVPLDGVATKHRLRVTGPTRLSHLESRYAAGLRPSNSIWQGYGQLSPTLPESANGSTMFDPNLLILARMDGPRLALHSALQLTEALRGAVMAHCLIQPPPEWISGHTLDGRFSEQPHLAFVPLADVGHEHADGHVLAVAIVVPRSVTASEQQALGAVLFATETGEPSEIELRMKAGVWRIRLAVDDARIALQPETWTAEPVGSTLWATVTPVAFDRHPKQSWKTGDPPRLRAERQAAYWSGVENMIAQACENIGLPRPVEVTATGASAFRAAAPAGQMPRLLRKDDTHQRQTHAIIRFDAPVVGPVLLGAGRYRGYGLCRPLNEGGTA